jgi:FkbM family methyltransferase
MVDARTLFRRGKLRVLNLLRLPLRARAIDEQLARLTYGRSPDDWIARVPANNHLYRSPSPRRVVRDGLVFELDISDYMEWMVYFGVAIEPREPLLALAHAGDVVLDVGANIGETGLQLARRVGERGSVFAFEPHPQIFARAQRNFALNSMAQLHLLPFGLGAEAGTLALAAPTEANRGSMRVAPDQRGVPVRITTLDDFVAERGLRRVDLIKIDVEGFEHHALRGGRKLLEQQRPRLFVEIDDTNLRAQGSSARDLAAMLEDLDYRLTHAQRNMPISRDYRFEDDHFDLIAAPK